MRNKKRLLSRLATRVAGSMLMAALTPLAWAQVSESPVKDLTPAPTLKPFGDLPAGAPRPSSDPHDLNGVYIGLRGAPPPQAARGDGARPPGPPADSAEGSPHQRCIPVMAIGSSGYTDQIVQTPRRITFIGETNNIIRRVYLDRDFPKTIPSTYLGYSVGHWDGDTLVVTTRGLQDATVANNPAMAAITRVIERVRKLEGGLIVEDVATIEGTDRDGKAMTLNRTGRLSWRSDLHLMEFNCEEGAVLYFVK